MIFRRISLVIYYCNQNNGGEKGNKLARLFAVSKVSGRVSHKRLFNKTYRYRWDVKCFYRFKAKRLETKQEDKWLLFSLVKAPQQLLLKPGSDPSFLPEFINTPPQPICPPNNNKKAAISKMGTSVHSLGCPRQDKAKTDFIVWSLDNSITGLIQHW